MSQTTILGIDIGGSGIKGAPVDLATGTFLAERFRLATPKSGKPDAVAKKVAEIVAHFDYRGPIGCGFPGVIQNGHALTAANVAKTWIGVDVAAVLHAATGCPVAVANDADVAGLAEMRLGAGKEQSGTVLVVTLGTGIGTALFTGGVLLPNSELGHLEIAGREAEKWASAAVREKKKLSWKKWARRIDRYLDIMHAYLWPELVIIGGGVSRKHDKFLPLLTVPTRVVPAQFRNRAGIIGAALYASEASLL